MASQHNAAYKFDLFEPQKQRTEPQIKVIQNQKIEKLENRRLILKVVAYVSIFFVGIISVLFNQIAITEVTNEVSAKNNELSALQNEYRMLQTELESTIALANVESMATRTLGMTKLTEDQITYVNLSDGDVKTVPEDGGGNVLSRIWKTFKNIVEYIREQ